MKLDARTIANELVKQAHEAERLCTPMQAIKLTYFCHGWMLGLYEEPLILQPVEAWRYGPVIADVYHSFKRYGGGNIAGPTPAPAEDMNDRQADLVGQVSQDYGLLSGIRLSQITHAPGTPWDVVWRKERQNAVIPNRLLQDYFSKMAAAANDR